MSSVIDASIRSGFCGGSAKRFITRGSTFDRITPVPTTMMSMLNLTGNHKKSTLSGDNFAVVSFYLSVSNNLKTLGIYFGANVVWQNSFTLSKLTPFLSGADDSRKRRQARSIPCKEGVVYNIGVARGKA